MKRLIESFLCLFPYVKSLKAQLAKAKTRAEWAEVAAWGSVQTKEM